MKEARALVIVIDQRLRADVDGVYYIISNPEDVKVGDIVIARYQPEDQFAEVIKPQQVYQVFNEHGYDAGTDLHMAVFERRELADQWVEMLADDCPGETFTIEPKEIR